MKECPLTYDEATTQALSNSRGAIALRKVCIEHFRVGDYGILSKRSVRGGDKLSVHAEGRAWDAKCDAFTEREKGDRLANFLWSNRKYLGIQKIIWAEKAISVLEPEWTYYTGEHRHNNHLHIELNKQAAEQLTVKDVRELLDI